MNAANVDALKIGRDEMVSALKARGFYVIKNFFLSKVPNCTSILDSKGKDALGGRAFPAAAKSSTHFQKTTGIGSLCKSRS